MRIRRRLTFSSRYCFLFLIQFQGYLFFGIRTNKKTQRHDILSIFMEIILGLLKIHWFIIEAIYRLFVPRELKSVRGEITLITGSGHGLGRELALQYAENGAIVVCWDINKENNEATVKEIAKRGYLKAHSYICDVANRTQVTETAQKVLKEVGDVGIIINNAGIMPSHPLLEHTDEEIEKIMNINVMAHFWILRALLPTMIKNNHGHVVALSSSTGLIPTKNLVPYCASKSAIRGMMIALEEELRQNPKNEIKFTTIYPYMIDTGLCKKPIIRFPTCFPIQKPIDVAKHIIFAQRSNFIETTFPRCYLTLWYMARLNPNKAVQLILDFINCGLDSDL